MCTRVTVRVPCVYAHACIYVRVQNPTPTPHTYASACVRRTRDGAEIQTRQDKAERQTATGQALTRSGWAARHGATYARVQTQHPRSLSLTLALDVRVGCEVQSAGLANLTLAGARKGGPPRPRPLPRPVALPRPLRTPLQPVCGCVCATMCLCMHACVYARLYACLCVCLYVCMYACTCVCVHARMCVRMSVGVVYRCMCVYVRVWMSMRATVCARSVWRAPPTFIHTLRWSSKNAAKAGLKAQPDSCSASETPVTRRWARRDKQAHAHREERATSK